MNSPATPTQRRLWALAHLRPGDPFYNVPFSVRMDGPLDREALDRAVTEVVRRHPALRTTLRQVDGELTRVVAPPAPVVLPSGPVDMGAFAREPFDLSSGPLFRARLVRDGDREHRLLVNVHHVVFDGASHDLFLDELTALYDAFTRGEPSPLPELPPHDAATTDSLDHWVRRLEGIPPVIPLPLKGPRPVTSDYRTARATRLIPPEVVTPLRLVARTRRASMFMLLKAACAVLLHQHGASDVVLGIPTSGRDTVESARHIGYLVKTVVTRTRFTGDPTFAEVLAHVRDDVLSAHEHADLPFEDVAQALGIPREAGHDPIYQVLFGYETAPVARHGGGVRFTPSYLSLDTAKADLDVLLSETEDGLAAHFDYRVDLLDADTVDRMLSRLETVLRRIGEDPDAPVSRLVRPDEEELARLRAWERPAPADVVEPHRLVEASVDRSPDAVAVEARGRTWTYAEVDALANRVARHARARVAVCLPLSGEFVAAVLGVFKAGGTCVLLDPDLPPYLLRAMAQDADVALVLSDAHSGGVFEDLPVTLVDSLDGPADRVTGAAGATFVAHTSESRGVEFDQRALGELLAWARRELPPVACAAPIGSPASGTVLFEVFAARAAGGRVTDEVEAATLVCGTPSLLGRLGPVAP
ncbi:MAG: AMP-binding protein, partial [Saccharothrix sp.]|nr:AMP-binding protein [Saccharothrix sp.]